MAINYEDERLQAVEQQKQEELAKAEEMYGGMIEKTEQIYQEQVDASKAWEEEQKKIQQEQTDYAIEQTEKQKEQAQKDYLKEQSAAYTDWQKQKNAYGVNAEQMAEAGLAGSGFSESAQASMYNTYQQRVAAAKESITQAVAEFDGAIQAAILQNNADMAEIAYQALQNRLSITLEGFQQGNQLLLMLEQEKDAIESEYEGKWTDVLEQLYAEEAAAIRDEQDYEIDDLYLPEDVAQTPIQQIPQTGGTKDTAKEVALSDDGSGAWYFPGAPEQAKKPSPQAIKNMQASLGVPQTGRWDAASRKAAGTQSLVEAYALWTAGAIGSAATKNAGSWRQDERTNEPTIQIDDSIPKMISDEELERMLDSGEAVMITVGNKTIVTRRNGLEKQMRTIMSGDNWRS